MAGGNKKDEAAASGTHERERLSSEDLAALVIDALIHAGIVKEEDVERAMKIAMEEINVRKILGDY